MAANNRKILVLMDMSGTICYRNEEPVRGVRSDLFIRRKHFYGRGGIHEFVQGLFDTERFTVCVYTSMMEHNAYDGLKAVLGKHMLKNMVEQVLDRKMNKPDPAGENEWDTIRDMKKVWAKVPGYGPARTILLDNEARKFKETPRNGIVVPEYGEAEVRSRHTSTLDNLLLYLKALGEVNPSDVREYMDEVEFRKGWENTLLKRKGVSVDNSYLDGDASSSQAELDDLFLNLAVTDREQDWGEHKDIVSGQVVSKPDLTLESLPIGTSVEFSCLDGIEFVMRGKTNGTKHNLRFFCVRGKAVVGVRIEKKMNLALLADRLGASNLTITEDKSRSQD